MTNQTTNDYLFYVKDITKTFRNRKTLKFCGEMTIRRGCLTFFTGESGIGKSTLLHILGLLDQADHQIVDSHLKYWPDHSQNMVIDYFDLYKQDLKYKLFSKGLCARLRRFDFGFLPQDGHLLNSLSIQENLEIIGGLRYQLGKKKVDIHAEFKAVIERVDLDAQKIMTEGKLSPSHLSGGEAQRLALARAIIHEPKVILVDEPTTFMDDKLVKQSMELLFDLTQKGCSIIVVTHQYQKLYEILSEKRKDIRVDNFCFTKDSQDRTTTFLKIKNDSEKVNILSKGLVGHSSVGVKLKKHSRNRSKKSRK